MTAQDCVAIITAIAAAQTAMAAAMVGLYLRLRAAVHEVRETKAALLP